jgi:hypothetical protein
MRRIAKLSQDDLDRAFQMREVEGLGFPEIARRFGVSPGCIAWHCLTHGVDLPTELRRQTAIPVRKPVNYRAGRVVRVFTAEDDAFILRLAAQGVSAHLTGKQMVPPRAGSSVLGRLHTLARHQARAEEMA